MKFKYYNKVFSNNIRKIARNISPGLTYLIKWLRYKIWFSGAYVSGDSHVSKDAEIGKHCVIRNSSIGEHVTIGRFTTLGEDCQIRGGGKISIGQFCSIGPECIILSENHNKDMNTTYPLEQILEGENKRWNEYPSKSVKIGNDVWMGTRVTVLAGASIGDGSIIGANSVVPAKEFPPYSIIAGTPAKVIDERFDPDIVEELLELKWWEKPEDEIFRGLMEKLHEEH